MNMEAPNAIDKVRRLAGHTGKMFVVGVLIIVCWIGSLLVMGVIRERSSRQSEAETQIAEQWGKAQLVAGPVVAVPFNKSVKLSNGNVQTTRKILYILPKDLRVLSDIKPELRSRGIFSAPVYRADLELSGIFVLPDFDELGIIASSLIWSEATVIVGLSDMRNIDSNNSTWNSATITFEPGSALWSVNGMGVHARIPWSLAQVEQKFDFKISISGTKSISYLPLGESTVVEANALWGSPSFVGAYLPTSEDLQKDNFSATWQVSALGRSYPNAWDSYGAGVKLNTTNFGYIGAGNDEIYGQALASSAFGVNLFREVTFYTLVERTVKYAILFIALTFLAFYLFEVMSRIRIHPFQYILIGAGLILFYLLLLSFSEHIGFAYAYLLSSVLTLGLVTAYSASVLKARSRAWIIAVILTVLYAYLYAILQLEQFALLFGTLFLFAALATVMGATRKIEWYKEVE